MIPLGRVACHSQTLGYRTATAKATFDVLGVWSSRYHHCENLQLLYVLLEVRFAREWKSRPICKAFFDQAFLKLRDGV